MAGCGCGGGRQSSGGVRTVMSGSHAPPTGGTVYTTQAPSSGTGAGVAQQSNPNPPPATPTVRRRQV